MIGSTKHVTVYRKDAYPALKVCIAGGGNATGVDNELSVSHYLNSNEAEHPGKGLLRLTMDEFQVHLPNKAHQYLVFTPLGLHFTKLRRLFPENSIPKMLVQQSL